MTESFPSAVQGRWRPGARSRAGSGARPGGAILFRIARFLFRVGRRTLVESLYLLTDEGLRAAIAAREHLPGAPMLVLSQYVEVSYAADLLADGSGAVGYLLKDRVAKVEEFLDALDRVARGATVLDPRSLPSCWPGSAGAALWRR